MAIDNDRIKTISAMLTEKPGGFGVPITDRAAWERIAAHSTSDKLITRAEELKELEIPESTDDLYLDFSRTGTRTNWQEVASQRRERIRALTLAECLENKGRFISSLEEIIRSLCTERTWVMPAHDKSLVNFKGEIVGIDLGSSMLGWNMAMAHYLLGNSLSSETRDLISDNIERRILQPYHDTVDGKHKPLTMNGVRGPLWWLTYPNNWNSVCLACVTGTALIMVDPREERAFYVAAAENYVKYFLQSFTEDGYCSEGLTYWNYGFGHFVLLTEALRQATRGRADLFDRGEVRQPALFGLRVQIVNDVYPAFADCIVDARPNQRLMNYINTRFGLPPYDSASSGTDVRIEALYESVMYLFPDEWSSAKLEPQNLEESPRHSWFDKAGMLICRPPEGTSGNFGAALKGGHNKEHHNHNDVGSYVVVVGSKPVLVDPGCEVYTSRTFSGERYESKVLNSLGHPVPVVAGRLQEPGEDARAAVVRSEFTDEKDILVLDMKSAYKVPSLIELERSFTYTRGERPGLIVSDQVAFSEPQTFGTALITLGQWESAGPRSLVIRRGESAVRVDIDTEGLEFDIEAETLDEDVRTETKPTRIGITLRGTVSEATVTLKINPLGKR